MQGPVALRLGVLQQLWNHMDSTWALLRVPQADLWTGCGSLGGRNSKTLLQPTDFLGTPVNENEKKFAKAALSVRRKRGGLVIKIFLQCT